MRFRSAAWAAIFSLLLTAVGSSQTASELLQKGIYTQRTVGDFDGAIAIYRQMIANSGADRATAARAQMLIVGAYLGKGDLNAAAREFTTLTQNYGDQKEAISAVTSAFQAAPQMRSGAVRVLAKPALRVGTLENGVYRHTATSTEIRLPAGWSVQMDGESSGGGDTVQIANGSNSVFIWMKSVPCALEEVSALLDTLVPSKWHQRRVDDSSESYKIRPGTQTKSGSGRRQNASVAFDFVEGGRARIEYGTWILTTKTLVYFRSYGEPASLGELARIHNALDTVTVVP
jgi:hypothetical protein